MRFRASLMALGLSALGVSALGRAQEFEPTSVPQSWPQDFRAVAGGQWVTEWHKATGTPRAIWGTGYRLPDWRENTLAEARRHAHRLLAEFRDSLALGASDFTESIGARMGRTWTFKFDQSFRGLPCIGGRADVRIHMTGTVAMIGSSAWQVPADFDTTPAVTHEMALAFAWQALGQSPNGVPQPAPVGAPRLVIWGDIAAAEKAPFFLAWEVAISNVALDGSGPIGRYYVDARTGKVLHWASDKHECGFAACKHPSHDAARTELGAPLAAPVPTTVTVMAWTRTGNDGFDPLVNVPLPGLVVSVPGVPGTPFTTDQNGQFTMDIAAPVNIAVNGLDGRHHGAITGADAPAGSFPVTPGVPATIQLLTAAATFNQGAHPTTSWWVDRANEWCRTILGNSAQMATASNVGPRVNIASTCNAYYTGNTINFYQAGGGCNNTAFSSVIVHEWGHGLDDRYGGISQVQGLSEGWGDILGCYLTDSPILGSGFQTAGVGIRNGNNTRLYPPPSEVHQAGEVWLGFAWRLRDRLAVTLGNRPAAIALTDDIVVGSIAADATDQPGAVREVFIADDDDGNLLNGTPHYAELEFAALAKNLPYPQIQFATIAHTPLANSTVELTPRKVLATVTPITGTLQQVRLHYNDGAARVRTMIPTGAANQWQALLPGRTAPSTTTYHIEAQLDSGTQRLPATGEYSYATAGPDVTFYTEGFETGGPGWTHGFTAGQDNWQIGDPTGFSGTNTGVSWADPANAAVGVNCAGNDLISDGLYANSQNNWFRSPVINCSGRSGVRLRFKRWLTVEEGIYDQARIRVNGTQVWVNPSNGHLRDTAWTQQDINIAAYADNNAAVTIEWSLQSDAGLRLGGWQIDDIQLVAGGTLAPLPARLTMLPEQAAVSSLVTLSIDTTGAQPFVLGIGDNPGPTTIPGIPPLAIGNFITLSGYTNPAGSFSFGFNAPATVAATGLYWYSQVLTLDAGFNLVVSNQFVNLFTP
jgi:hypothetical protein